MLMSSRFGAARCQARRGIHPACQASAQVLTATRATAAAASFLRGILEFYLTDASARGASAPGAAPPAAGAAKSAEALRVARQYSSQPTALGPPTPASIFSSNTQTLATSAGGRNAAIVPAMVTSRPRPPAALVSAPTPSSFIVPRNK